MKKTLILILFILFLSACKPAPKLETPQNLRYEDGIISYDTVINATGYIIEINDVEYTTRSTEYAIGTLGHYNVRVRAVAPNYTHSDFTESIHFEVLVLQIPTNLHTKFGFLHWVEIADAISYTITGGGLSITTETNFLKLNAFYELTDRVQIQANYSNGTSDYSEDIVFSSESTPTDEVILTFSTTTNFDLPVVSLSPSTDFVYIGDANLEPLTSNQYTYEHGIVMLNSSYLQLLPVGTHVYQIITKNEYYSISITINTLNQPYLISNPNVITDFSEDLIFLFDLKGGSLSVAGNDITESDYIIEGNTLTIYSDFVQSKFESDSNRNTLILSYTLSLNGANHIGYIFIKK